MGSTCFFIELMLLATSWPQINLACSRNYYQGYLMGLKVASAYG